MAKRDWFNPQDFADLIERFNPFGFKEPGGKVRTFEDYGKLYEYTLEKLALTFPRGYIDIPLFIHNETGMPIGDCENIVSDMKYCGITQEEWLVEIWESCAERNTFFRMLLNGLHMISETSFSESYYIQALRNFDMKLEIIKQKAFKEDE